MYWAFFIGANVATASEPEPMWQACRQRVRSLTAEEVLAGPLPDLPRGGPADRAHDVPGHRLVVDRDGGWTLDGEAVADLPELDEVVVFADTGLLAPEVVRLFHALHDSGARVWLARLATSLPAGVAPDLDFPDGNPAAHDLAWRVWMPRCQAGRALLEPGTGSCSDLAERWQAAESSRRCHLHDRHLALKLDRDAPGPGTAISLTPLPLDPDRVTWWSSTRQLGDLEPGEVWVELGSRPPGSYLPVETASWRSFVPLARPPPHTCWGMPETCRVRLFVEPDGSVSSLRSLTCRPRTAAFLREVVPTWECAWGTGSEGCTRIVTDVDFTVCVDRPVVDLSDTSLGRSSAARAIPP